MLMHVIFSIILIIIVILLGLLIYTKYNYYKLRIIDKEYQKLLDNKKPFKPLKVLVFQCGAYTQNPEYMYYSMMINKLYCSKWGYDYRFINHDIKEMPPYWLKVKDLKNLLNDTSKYDMIVYLDLDAIFNDFSVSIEQVIDYVDPNENYEIYVSYDWIVKYNEGKGNAGVFIVKNTPNAKNIVSKWYNMCVCDNKLCNKCASWEYSQHKWNCPDCKWAGINYEQGSLNQIYDNNNDIILLNTDYLSNTDYNKQSYVLHLMAHDNNLRKDILKNIYENILMNKNNL